jgi:hypothetical protein
LLTKPKQWEPEGPAVSTNPSHLRAQAKIDFELAQLMSLPDAADVFRQSAQECAARAAELEAQASKATGSARD